MASCLGIYLGSDIVRYAKLDIDASKNVELKNYGVRFIKGNLKEVLSNIVEETNSQGLPIAINPENSIYFNTQMFEQSEQIGTYIKDVVNMEFEAWCEKNAKSKEKYNHVYMLSALKGSDNKRSLIINVLEKRELEEQSKIGDNDVTNMIPGQLTTVSLVPKEEQNYILVDLDTKLVVTTVLNGKIGNISYSENGMRKIFADMQLRLGSYQKAYEACKQINVYSEDGNTNNDPALEKIVEPVLQNVLKTVLVEVNRNRKQITKVLISGSGILFTNIDILFSEFLGVKTEILKPSFVNAKNGIKNIAEVLETTEAISLAYEAINHNFKELEYIVGNKKVKRDVKDWFKKLTTKKKEELKEIAKERNVDKVVDPDAIPSNLVCVAIVCSIFAISYLAFSIIFNIVSNNSIKRLDAKRAEVEKATQEVMSDYTYISSNTSQYTEITDRVESIIKQIENGEIGKFHTYNVAAFMQNILKITPNAVVLKSLSSDDDKNVTIVARSASYPDLGYFLAQLKADGTLKNIKIKNITNGSTSEIEIGGELP